MVNKIKKAAWYLKLRFYEFKISIKEFNKGSKLNPQAYNAYVDNSMLVEAHSIEKGLGLRNVQPGHSGKVVSALLSKLLLLSGTEPRRSSFAFRETFRIIDAYMQFQEEYDTSKFKGYPEIKVKYDKLCSILGEEYIENAREEIKAGARLYTRKELLEGKFFDFESFINSRHSMRTYTEEPISDNDITEAVRIANKSPSACNRQPSKVYFCSDKDKVHQIDELITGSSGFKGETPNYIVLTEDRACFSYVEQYQWYINGGIYLAYLSLALHSLGIGHCVMQWKAFYRTETELKRLLSISDREAIIAIIGCGYYRDETRCIMAQRKSVEDTLKIIK